MGNGLYKFHWLHIWKRWRFPVEFIFFRMLETFLARFYMKNQWHGCYTFSCEWIVIMTFGYWLIEECCVNLWWQLYLWPMLQILGDLACGLFCSMYSPTVFWGVLWKGSFSWSGCFLLSLLNLHCILVKLTSRDHCNYGKAMVVLYKFSFEVNSSHFK